MALRLKTPAGGDAHEAGARAAFVDTAPPDRGLLVVSCTVSTENPVDMHDLDGRPYKEVLLHEAGAIDLERAPLPLLEGHNRSVTNIGVVANLRIEDRKLRGDLVLGESPRARALEPDIRSGIVSGLSVSFQYLATREEPGGSTVTVTRWRPVEVSIASVPADIQSGIGRSLAEPPAAPLHEVPNRGLAPQTKGSTMTDEEIKAAQEKAAAEAVRAERERSIGIRSACEKLGQRDLADKLIADGVTLEKARELVIEAHAERTAKVGSPSGIEVGKEETEKFAEGARGWLLEKAGVTGLVGRAQKLPGLLPEQASVLAGDLSGGACRGMRLTDLAREMVERSGVSTRLMSSREIAKRALNPQGARAYTPASDFSVLFENVMHKVLMASYLTQPTTFENFCAPETVSDLRPANRYRAGGFGTLDVVAEGGEYTNKAIPDGVKQSITTEKRGNIISLSLEAMIADDMGALNNVAAKFGASWRLTLEKAFYALLAQNSGLGPTMGDGKSFFHADHGNIGTGSALSIAGLDADRILFKKQMDVSSQEYLDLVPASLLVSTELESTAKMYNTMQYSDVNSKYAMPNIVNGMFRSITGTPRLTGNRRYIFADVGNAPAFVVAYLEGYGQAPSIETQQGWRTDGVEYKVRFFAKVQAFDYKTAVTNAGA